MELKACLEEENLTIYTYEDEKGDAQIKVYHVFPGLEVAYASVHNSWIDFTDIEGYGDDGYIGFHYCKEGRIEQETDDEFFYLMPGDCSVLIQNQHMKKFSLPLKHYHGISIGIDMIKIQSRFSDFLGNDSIEPRNLAKKLCGERHSVVLRNVEPLKHIFSESYQVPEEQRVDYIKIKILELLFVMSKLDDISGTNEENYVPRSQAELVKKAAAYITENINDKLSLNDLTAMFGVSDTYLQKAFRSVYGVTVASFVRIQKMQNAAQELIHTDRTIDEIAEEFGYINESKFSAAFKKIMGDSPSVFRREHSKIKIR